MRKFLQNGWSCRSSSELNFSLCSYLGSPRIPLRDTGAAAGGRFLFAEKAAKGVPRRRTDGFFS